MPWGRADVIDVLFSPSHRDRGAVSGVRCSPADAHPPALPCRQHVRAFSVVTIVATLSATITGCSSADDAPAPSATLTTVYAPMTSISAADLAKRDAESAAADDTGVVGPNNDVTTPAGARELNCQHFDLSDGGRQRKVPQGLVRIATVEDTAKGPQVMFYLNDFLPADFSATIVQLGSDARDSRGIVEANGSAVRRVIVRDAQLSENYLRIDGQDRTFVGDFYTLLPDQGRAQLVIPSQDAQAFAFDSATVAAFITKSTMSRCILDNQPAQEPTPLSTTPEGGGEGDSSAANTTGDGAEPANDGSAADDASQGDAAVVENSAGDEVNEGYTVEYIEEVVEEPAQ